MILGSNPGPETAYPHWGFLITSKQTLGEYLKIGHNHFRSYPTNSSLTIHPTVHAGPVVSPADGFVKIHKQINKIKITVY
jgi:hypothetical protein